MSDRQPDYVDVEVYLTVEPRWKNRYYRDAQDRPVLDGGTVVKATQSKPRTTGPKGGVVTKLTLRFPVSAFLPLQPEAVVVIQQGDTETIVVEASAPGSET